MKPEEFTHSVEVMQTFELTWSPTEPGRWLYHCHRIPHMQLPVPLDPADVIAADSSTHDHQHMHDMTSDYSGMGGMIMGITVTGKSVIDTVNNWNPTHKIEMGVGKQKGEAGAYEISLKDRGQHCEGSHRRDRHIHQCASRYGATARRCWPANRCGGATPAG